MISLAFSLCRYKAINPNAKPDNKTITKPIGFMLITRFNNFCAPAIAYVAAVVATITPFCAIHAPVVATITPFCAIHAPVVATILATVFQPCAA